MTPQWRRAIKPLLSSRSDYDKATLGLLASSRCFDIDPARNLLISTADELKAASVNVENDDLLVDVGARVCFPAKISWLEWGDIGVLLNSNVLREYDDHTESMNHQVAGVFVWAAGHHDGAVIGNIDISGGVARVQVFANKDIEALNKTAILFQALSALAIIASPAAKSETVEGHRGLARKIRSAVPRAPREIHHTKVVIGRPRASGLSGLSAHPKAYHFCRAHVRTRLGKLERVRAHWRGDPAFGIRLPSYMVRPTPA